MLLIQRRSLRVFGARSGLGGGFGCRRFDVVEQDRAEPPEPAEPMERPGIRAGTSVNFEVKMRWDLSSSDNPALIEDPTARR
jgi:hypothetical protein